MHRFHKQSASPTAGRLLWPSLLCIVLCLFCLCGTTLAWFTAAQSAGVAPVTAASFAAKVTVTTAAANGETVLPFNADGSVSLAAGVPYTVTIDASASTASGGYVRFAAVPAADGQATAALPAESAAPAQPTEAAQTPETAQASEMPAEPAAEVQNSEPATEPQAAEPTDETPTTEPAQNTAPTAEAPAAAQKDAQPVQAAAVPQSFVTCRFDSKTPFTFTIIPQQALTLSWQASWGAPTEAGIASGAVLGTLPNAADSTVPGGESQPQPDDSTPAQNPSDSEGGSSAPDGSSDSQPDSVPSDTASSDASSEDTSSEDTSSEDTSSSGASGGSSSGTAGDSSENSSQDSDSQPADASSGEETPAPDTDGGSSSSAGSAPQEESAPAALFAAESDAKPQP